MVYEGTGYILSFGFKFTALVRFVYWGLLISIIQGASLSAQNLNQNESFQKYSDKIVEAGRSGKFEEAIQFSLNGLRWATTTQQDSARGVFSFFAGMGYQELSNRDSALYFLDQAVSISKEHNYIGMLVRSKLVMLSIYQLQLFDLAKSQQIIDELSSYVEELGSKSYQAKFLGKKAYQEKQGAHFDKALKYYLEELELHHQLQDEVNEGIALQNIGVLLHDMRRDEESIVYFKKAIKLCEKVDALHRAALPYLNIGNAFFSLLQFDSAKYYFNKSIEVARAYNIEAVLGSAYQALARVSLEVDFSIDSDRVEVDSEEVEKKIKQSLEISKRLNRKGLEVDVLLTLGKRARNKKQFPESEEYFLEAWQLGKKISSHLALLSISENLSKLYMEQRNFEKAQQWTLMVLHYKDSLYQEAILKNSMELEAKFQSTKKEQEIERLVAKNKMGVLEQKNQRQQYLLILGSGSFLIIVFGLFWYFKNRQKIIVKDHELSILNKRVDETRQVALRSQMNPHFVFNLIATIDSYILKNEKNKASQLLTSFANMVRMVLENSEQNMIAIQDEIACVESYLKIEQLRFNNQFEYSILIDPNMDFEVPPLILQPYVENAIIHGLLLSDNDDKQLEIRVEENSEEDVLICIRDNGVGVEKSAEINQRNRPSHVSMGTRITEERMQLWQTAKGITSTVAISNRKDTAGTEVNIVIKR